MTATKKWYVVHTYSGFEEKARQGLERIKLHNMEDKFGQIFVPVRRPNRS
jgi:transcriptional antiterminator NusG